jgi:hypothetical protein
LFARMILEVNRRLEEDSGNTWITPNYFELLGFVL